MNNLKMLPRSWHIVVTEENQDVLSNWINNDITDWKLPIGNICGAPHGVGSKGHNPPHQIKSDDGRYNFGKEITFEQFKKWVLKKEPIIIKDDLSCLEQLLKDIS